jgi:segregation and condensation protein B
MSELGGADLDPFTLRLAEALLFAAREPLSLEDLAGRLPERTDVAAVLSRLQQDYAPRGVNLVAVAGKWMFRTASDLGFSLSRMADESRKLSRAAMEVLAIIAYHQPVTRAEIEAIRGVATSKGTLDVLMETGWVKMRGRRRSPGRPVTWGITEHFLVHFGLNSLDDLPGVEELKATGLLEGRIAPAPHVALADEDPIGEADLFDALGDLDE